MTEHDPEQAGVFRIPAEESGNRATVAMVFRAVDDLKAITEAHFDTVKVKLDGLSALPPRVAALETRADSYDGRITALEKESEEQAKALQDRRQYRTTTLPMILLGLGGLLFSGLGVLLTYVALHH